MRFTYSLLFIICGLLGSLPFSLNASIFTGVGYSDSQDAFNAAARRFIHHAGNFEWVAFHDGNSPVLYNSPDGISWTEVDTGNTSNHLFTTPDPEPADWGARFSGNTLYLVGATPSMVYYEKYTLESDGRITKNMVRTEEIGTHGTNNEANLTLTATGLVRAFWRYDPRVYFMAANADETVWDDRYKTGFITQVNSYFPFALPLGTGNDLLMLAFDDTATHEIRSMPYTDATDTWGASELIANDLNATAPQYYQQQISAVRTNNQQLHLVYITQSGLIAHKSRGAGLTDPWSTQSSDITGSNTHSRLSLTTDGTYLWIFYDKSNQQIFTRQWDKIAWQDEIVVKSSTNVLQGAITSAEHVVGNEIGIAWTEGMATPYAIEFEKITVTTPTVTPTPSITTTPIATASPLITATPQPTPLPAPGLTLKNKIIRASRGEQPELIVRLEKPGHLRLRIYNLNGKQITKLADRDYPAGIHPFTWNIQDVGSGTYWILLESPDKKTKDKIVITR